MSLQEYLLQAAQPLRLQLIYQDIHYCPSTTDFLIFPFIACPLIPRLSFDFIHLVSPIVGFLPSIGCFSSFRARLSLAVVGVNDLFGKESVRGFLSLRLVAFILRSGLE